ncbi:hypothetical protein DFQ28_002285 [Apophysomyces sp. BC1034]|nr:hypothetical protein DFQ30_003980 [Apophysomyces sp. BC1015]KAG0178681.1 hypothetical protein DFQ29_003125 [Apophysomyces sp. BC1021]KAG0190248.1 hypothetical protein DFQ28_002285 [Apophysomyces sp. BC1034]
MTITNIRNHAYTFEHALQLSNDYSPLPLVTSTRKSTVYFTWLVFMHAKWVPFDASNQSKLEQTLNLGGTFVDIQDSHFPDVKRVRVFPKSNYLSYLGVKYRLSRVMQPDAWIDPPDHDESASNSSSFSSIDDDEFYRMPPPPEPSCQHDSVSSRPISSRVS